MTTSPTITCGSWRGSHPTGSLALAAQALGLAVLADLLILLLLKRMLDSVDA
jgi:hypothetical protein